MKDWIDKTNQKLWAKGRYGIDAFSWFQFCMGLGMLILSRMDFLWFLWLFAIFPLLWSPVRCLSKKLEEREIENEAFLAIAEQTKESFVLIRLRWTDRKTFRYVRCPDCDTILQFPIGQGEVKLICPGCDREMIRKT